MVQATYWFFYYLFFKILICLEKIGGGGWWGSNPSALAPQELPEPLEYRSNRPKLNIVLENIHSSLFKPYVVL